MLPVRLMDCKVPLLMRGIKWIDAVSVGFDIAVEKMAVALGAPSVEPGTSHSPIANDTEISLDSSENVDLEAALDRAELQRAHWFHDALDYFEDRLAKTFPGVRGLQVYTRQVAFEKLTLLLKEPLTLPTHLKNAPLWWWRGTGNMYIEHFKVLDETPFRCLVSTDELLIDTVAVYRNITRPYRSFVYVSARADKPTGIYSYPTTQIEAKVAQYGYASEEVAYWNGRYISRREYDDGYAEIEGKVVKLNGAELRHRYLTPYNLFITSQTSVFNTIQFDNTLKKLCQGLIQGTTQLEDVVEIVEDLKLTGRVEQAYFLID